MGVFSISLSGVVVDNWELGVDLVADDLRERPNVDVVGRADIHRLAVGTVVVEQAMVGVDDIGNVGEITSLFAVAVDFRRFAPHTPGDEVADRHVGTHSGAVDGEIAQRDRWEAVHLGVDAHVVFDGDF